MKNAATTPAILRSRCFGPYSRYRLDDFRTRFGTVEFIVTDAERPDETGRPSVIRQAETDAGIYARGFFHRNNPGRDGSGSAALPVILRPLA